MRGQNSRESKESLKWAAWMVLQVLQSAKFEISTLENPRIEVRHTSVGAGREELCFEGSWVVGWPAGRLPLFVEAVEVHASHWWS